MEKEQTVSLQGMMKWALEERTARELANLPTQKELEALYPDTSAFRKRVFDEIARMQKEEARPKRPRLRVFKKILLVAAILVSLLSCMLMTSAAVRNAVANTIIEWTGRDMGVRFEMEGTPLTHLPEDYGPHYIPEGLVYQADLSFCNEVDGSFSYAYESADRTSILGIEIGIAQNGSFYYMDNEHTEFEMITFQDTTAYLGQWSSAGSNVKGYSMLWVKDGLEHHIYGTVDLSDLFQIAENIY